MQIVDAQVHDVQPWFEWAKWEPEPGPATRSRVRTELMIASMDAVGVDAALISPGFTEEGNAWAALAVQAHPERFAIQLSIDALAPDMSDAMHRAAEQPGVVAIRSHLNDWRRGRGAVDLAAGLLDPFFDEVESIGLPLFCFMLGDAAHLARIAQQHPDLRLIVDHLGLVQGPVMSQPEDPWQHVDDVLALARFPNVAIKVCGANLLSERPYPHVDVIPHLRAFVDAFGVERLMWASDFTRMRLGSGPGWAAWYSDCLGYLRDSDGFDDAEKEQLFGGSIRRWVGWPASSSSITRPSWSFR